jgi:UDPglucose 6-dehydrogenase
MADGHIAVIGSGYVGLTSGACLASLGHDVVCGDVDAGKVAALSRGEVPILEPGLDEMVAAGIESGKLTFVHGAAAAAKGAKYIFLCLPTPDGGDGRADLRIVHNVVAEIGPVLDPGAILVTKSTVPVGTAKDITATVNRADIAVVSNPEFLQEGTAVRNFMNPDRIVVGSTDRDAAVAVAKLYEKFGAPSVVTSAESSELIKYASNAFLAMKLSFINSVGALAETVGADVAEIAGGMGFDERIGPKFLRTGPGWGGSCFPKDTRALAMIAGDNDVSFPLLEATTVSNDEAQDRVADKVRQAAGGSLHGVQVALWGLTFKAGTDDLRDSPALAVASRLAAEGAQLRGFDPAISADVKAAKDRPNISVAPDAYSAVDGAAVLVVLTEWPEFRELDLLKTAEGMTGRVIVDSRSIIDPTSAALAGFRLVPLGRPPYQ